MLQVHCFSGHKPGSQNVLSCGERSQSVSVTREFCSIHLETENDFLETAESHRVPGRLLLCGMKTKCLKDFISLMMTLLLLQTSLLLLYIVCIDLLQLFVKALLFTVSEIPVIFYSTF